MNNEIRKPEGAKLSLANAALLLVFTASIFGGCAGAPTRVSTPPPPPDQADRARVPPVKPPPPAALPRLKTPSLATARPVRVLLGEARKSVALAGEDIRAWNASGMPVASGAGSFHLSAIGEKIRWGKSKLLSSPIDVASTAGLRIDGKTAVSRIRVTAVKGKLYPVAVVPLEEYVAAVSAREAPSSFHPESLSALAVSVRTYVLLSMEKPRASTHDVVASVEDQVFEGLDGVAPVYRKAAESTSGEVIGYGDSLARAVFHSTCGGRTENAKDAWGSEVPYLHSVVCGDCLDSPAHKWNYRMTSKEGRRIAQSLGVIAGEDLRFAVTEKSSTGRASRVRISSGGVSREVSAAVFRKTVGYSKVKSLRMKIGSDGNGWNFTGEGYGHGVGMCQWGANGMAKNGKTYTEILARYYPGTYLARGIP